MNRRRMLTGMTTAIAAAGLPALPALATPATRPRTPVPENFTLGWDGQEWLRIMKSLGYELRKQYIANLRQLADTDLAGHRSLDIWNELVDRIEALNERGGFA